MPRLKTLRIETAHGMSISQRGRLVCSVKAESLPLTFETIVFLDHADGQGEDGGESNDVCLHWLPEPLLAGLCHIVLIFDFSTEMLGLSLCQFAPELDHMTTNSTYTLIFNPKSPSRSLKARSMLLEGLKTIIRRTKQAFNKCMRARKLVLVGLDELLDPASPRFQKDPLPKRFDYAANLDDLNDLVVEENQKVASGLKKDSPVLQLELMSYAEYLKEHDWEGKVGWDVARNMLRISKCEEEEGRQNARKRQGVLVKPREFER